MGAGARAGVWRLRFSLVWLFVVVSWLVSPQSLATRSVPTRAAAPQRRIACRWRRPLLRLASGTEHRQNVSGKTCAELVRHRDTTFDERVSAARTALFALEIVGRKRHQCCKYCEYKLRGEPQPSFFGTVSCAFVLPMLPTCLSVTDRTNFVYIAPDKLTVTYTGQGHHSHDVGAVRSDVSPRGVCARARTRSRAGSCRFRKPATFTTLRWTLPTLERAGGMAARCTRVVWLIARLLCSSLAVGLASSDFSLNRYPGCEPRSVSTVSNQRVRAHHCVLAFACGQTPPAL